MNFNTDHSSWTKLSYAEKKAKLFLNQKELLDTMLDRGAISKAQHDKSLHDLMEMMYQAL